MALRIRLSRAGAKKRPFYHIIVADVRAPRDGRHIERLGSYNPLISKAAPVEETKDKSRLRLSMDEERIKFWLARGALPSDRVAQFLDAANILEAKPKQNPQKAKPKAKAQARAQAAIEAKEKAETAAAAAAAEAEAAPAEESPAEEPQTEESPKEKSPKEAAPTQEPVAEDSADAASADAPAADGDKTEQEK